MAHMEEAVLDVLSYSLERLGHEDAEEVVYGSSFPAERVTPRLGYEDYVLHIEMGRIRINPENCYNLIPLTDLVHEIYLRGTGNEMEYWKEGFLSFGLTLKEAAKVALELSLFFGLHPSEGLDAMASVALERKGFPEYVVKGRIGQRTLLEEPDDLAYSKSLAGSEVSQLCKEILVAWKDVGGEG